VRPKALEIEVELLALQGQEKHFLAPVTGANRVEHVELADCLASDIYEDMAPSLLPREIGDTI